MASTSSSMWSRTPLLARPPRQPRVVASEAAPTTYSIAPNLTAPVNMQAAIGVEHRFGQKITIASTYINSHGVHQLYSDNINAFLPGTYDITTGTGMRPNGINENIYQYQSGGIYNQNQLSHQLQHSRAQDHAFWFLHGELRQGRYLGSNILSFQSI